MNSGKPKESQTRRQFVQKAAYVAPAIVTLRAMPTFASSGSNWSKDAEKDAKEAAKEAEKAAKEAAKEAEKQAKEAAKEAAKQAKST